MHALTGPLVNCPTDRRGVLSLFTRPAAQCGTTGLKKKLHVDFSTCVIMPNGPERTMQPQTQNVIGVPPLGLPLPDVLSCGVLLCHLLPSHAGSLCWVVKVLLGNPPLKHCKLTVTSAFIHSQVHFHLPGPALCCNATLPAKKRNYSFGFPTNSKDLNPLLT